MSPPYDHDLNPIAERVIGVLSELASAMRADCGGKPTFWTWFMHHAVNWHNCTAGHTGSSPADPNIMPISVSPATPRPAPTSVASDRARWY